MNVLQKLAVGLLVALLCLPGLTSPQVADDSRENRERENREKVGDILAALQAEPGKQIADVGAGEGFYSIRIARAVGSTGRVTAVDISDQALEQLRTHLQRKSVSNVDVVLGAIDSPHLPVETFDAVLIYNAYHEMTEHEAMLRGVFAGLKPGGRLVMVDRLHDDMRSATRANQIKQHQISDDYAEQELRAAGFQIVGRRSDFLASGSTENEGGFWLIVATKPF